LAGHKTIAREIGESCFREIFRCALYSQSEFLIFASYNFSLSHARNSAFVFIAAKVLLIHPIDFFFQNFPNRTKKNNQLDRPSSSQYFFPTSYDAREAFDNQALKRTADNAQHEIASDEA
jgi:hypothetical protein